MGSACMIPKAFAAGEECPSAARPGPDPWGFSPIDRDPMITSGGRVAPTRRIPRLRREATDSRPPTDLQATGTLPLSGQERAAMPAPTPSDRELPAWLPQAREG